MLEAATAAVERVFAGLDATFSLYRPDSEASRLARGEVTLRDASAAFRARFADATGWRLLTDGFFTPERPDGVLDLSGIIKGYAIDQAAAALESAGIEDWCLNAGGDVLVSGSPAPGTGTPWLAGIVDPQDRRALLSGFSLGGTGRFTALATSGTAERGNHIWRAGARPGADSDRSTSARCRWRPRTFSPPTCSRRPSSPAGGGCWTGPPTAGTSRCSPSSAAGNCSRRRGSAPRGA